MYNPYRVLKVLKAFALLKGQLLKLVKLLAKQLKTNNRALYKCLELIKELGFIVIKDGLNRSNTLFNVHIGSIIENLSVAIANKKKVGLKKYYRIQSNTISKKKVEPFQFKDNYQYICAFEHESNSSKFFAIKRIKDVKITTTVFQSVAQHLIEPIDIFSFSSTSSTYIINVVLNLRSFVLLKIEYPDSISHRKKDRKTNKNCIQATVNNLKHITRFVRGLLIDTTVFSTLKFIHYLKEH